MRPICSIMLIILISLSSIPFNSYAQSCTTCGATGWTTTVQSGVTKTYTVPALTGSTYNWVTSGGLSIVSGQGTNSVSVLPNSSGQLCISRSKSGSGACTDCAQISVIPPPNNPSTLSISINNCSSVTGTVNAVSGATSYNWYVDDILVGSTTTTSKTVMFLVNPSFKYGSHTLCVEALNQFGVPSAGRLCKQFTACPPPPPASLNIEFSGCTSLTATIPYVERARYFNWYVDGVFFRTTSPNTGKVNSLIVNLVDYPYLVSGAGKGAIVHDLCVESVDEFGIVSTKLCDSFSKRCEPDEPYLSNVSVQNCLSIVGTASVVYAQFINWYVDGAFYSKMPIDGKVLTLTVPLDINPALQTGEHTFCIDAENQFGKSTRSCKTVNVNCIEPPDGGGGGGGGGGLDEQLEIFPNPGFNKITIDFPVANNYAIELLDSNGLRVAYHQSTQSTTIVPVNDLQNGNYFVKVSWGGKVIYRQIRIDR